MATSGNSEPTSKKENANGSSPKSSGPGNADPFNIKSKDALQRQLKKLFEARGIKEGPDRETKREQIYAKLGLKEPLPKPMKPLLVSALQAAFVRVDMGDSKKPTDPFFNSRRTDQNSELVTQTLALETIVFDTLLSPDRTNEKRVARHDDDPTKWEFILQRYEATRVGFKKQHQEEYARRESAGEVMPFLFQYMDKGFEKDAVQNALKAGGQGAELILEFVKLQITSGGEKFKGLRVNTVQDLHMLAQKAPCEYVDLMNNKIRVLFETSWGLCMAGQDGKRQYDECFEDNKQKHFEAWMGAYNAYYSERRGLANVNREPSQLDWHQNKIREVIAEDYQDFLLRPILETPLSDAEVMEVWNNEVELQMDNLMAFELADMAAAVREAIQHMGGKTYLHNLDDAHRRDLQKLKRLTRRGLRMLMDYVRWKLKSPHDLIRNANDSSLSKAGLGLPTVLDDGIPEREWSRIAAAACLRFEEVWEDALENARSMVVSNDPSKIDDDFRHLRELRQNHFNSWLFNVALHAVGTDDLCCSKKLFEFFEDDRRRQVHSDAAKSVVAVDLSQLLGR